MLTIWPGYSDCLLIQHQHTSYHPGGAQDTLCSVCPSSHRARTLSSSDLFTLSVKTASSGSSPRPRRRSRTIQNTTSNPGSTVSYNAPPPCTPKFSRATQASTSRWRRSSVKKKQGGTSRSPLTPSCASSTSSRRVKARRRRSRSPRRSRISRLASSRRPRLGPLLSTGSRDSWPRSTSRRIETSRLYGI
jgi:hypothetical protein